MSIASRRRALMGMQSKVAPILPAEYQQVEYIASSGTQYINTGVTYYKHTVYLDAKFKSSGAVIGTGASGQMSNKEYTMAYVDIYGIVVSANNYGSGQGCWMSWKSYGFNRFEVLSNDSDGKLVFNGTTYTPAAKLDTNQQTTYPLWMFARNYGGTINNPSSSEIYRAKIWNKTTGELLRDFVPCYRKSDGEIGMYDIVNNVFYTNAGTGTFTKGGNV